MNSFERGQYESAIATANSIGGILSEKIKNLEAQRDELLAAMNRYLPFLPNSSAKDGGANKYSENLKAADQFREAIAKAVQP